LPVFSRRKKTGASRFFRCLKLISWRLRQELLQERLQLGQRQERRQQEQRQERQEQLRQEQRRQERLRGRQQERLQAFCHKRKEQGQPGQQRGASFSFLNPYR
jgi:hypothetical protein